MDDLNLYSVNWQDGMLITERHLKEQEKYFEELTRWHSLHIGDRYGLVRKSFDGKPAIGFRAVISGNRLKLEITRCQALTPDGNYIEISETLRNPIGAEVNVTEPVIPVYISVDAVSKRQVGDPDPEEDLPRIPYRVNNYTAHLQKPSGLPESSYLKVAELVVSGSDVRNSDTYFPPSLSLNADERLSQKAVDYRNRLENLLSLASRAHLAVSVSGAMAGESTQLQLAFRETVYLLVYHLAASIDDFVIGRNAYHPLRLVIFFKKLFRVFSTLINLQPGLKDYLNEKYFTKELNTDVGKFIAIVEAFIMKEYDHQALGEHIQSIDEILGVLRGVLGFLAQTKREQLGEQAMATDTLTYSGRTYRVAPFSSNRLEQVGELCYLMIDVAQPRAVADAVVLMSKDLFTVPEWNNMQVRLGLNDARGLGETDPVDVDTNTYGNKVALHPKDMMRSSSVRQITLIFRGAKDASKFSRLGKMDLIIYAM